MKNKALHRTFEVELSRLLDKKLYHEKHGLQYQTQDEDTKRHLYAAIDNLKRFLDNIS